MMRIPKNMKTSQRMLYAAGGIVLLTAPWLVDLGRLVTAVCLVFGVVALIEAAVCF